MSDEIFGHVRDATKRAHDRGAYLKVVCSPAGRTAGLEKDREDQARNNDGVAVAGGYSQRCKIDVSGREQVGRMLRCEHSLDCLAQPYG
jgi:hypothetical protein